MSDGNGKDFSNFLFNTATRHGSPTKAMTLSGHEVEKQETIYFKIPASLGQLKAGSWISLKCADYHNEHFLYIDPVYLMEGPEAKGHWFAMCTCGSPAIIIEPGATADHDSPESGNLLVCKQYMDTKTTYGTGTHLGQEQREWR